MRDDLVEIRCNRDFISEILKQALVDFALYPLHFALCVDAYEFLWSEYGGMLMQLLDLDPHTVCHQATERRREAQHLFEARDAAGYREWCNNYFRGEQRVYKRAPVTEGRREQVSEKIP